MPVKALKSIALFAVLIVLVGLACMSGSSTSSPEPIPLEVELSTAVATVEPTQTAEPTETVEPTETAAPSETSQPSPQQFFTEDFDSDSGYWDLNIVKNNDTSDPTKAMAGIKDGIFDFAIDGKFLTIYSFYTPFEYDNVKIDVKFENRGTNNNQVNIICRATEDGWYEFSISSGGLYKIYAIEPGKGYRKLQDGGSTKIKPGKEFNEYVVICNDRTLSLYVNGTETRVFEENEYVFEKGLVGIGLSSFDQLPVEIKVDSVTISEP